MPKEGDIVEYRAVGTYNITGSGYVYGVHQIKDHDGRLVNVYVVSCSTREWPDGRIILGDGEIVSHGTDPKVLN